MLLTGLVGVVAGAGLAFGPAVGSDADIVGVPLDLPACAGSVRTNDFTMQANDGICLYDALAMLREEPRGGPGQDR